MFKRTTLFLFLLITLFVPAGVAAQTAPMPVRAVLFFSPTCPHCHYVMEEVLPPLRETYGEQLDVLEIDVSQPDGASLYETYLAYFQIADNRRGVPALVVGDTVLVGSQEIPAIFPEIIAANVVEGIDWPEIPGLSSFLDEGQVSTTDPVENSGMWLAWSTLLFLVATLIFAAWRIGSNPQPQLNLPAGYFFWAVPILAVLGLIVSGYLSYVELGQATAVCGPVGDCNAVQSSSYATIGGIPVALLGILYYLFMGALWLILPRINKDQHRPVALILLTGSLFGVLFSVYLTAVEVFVLEAVCAWCITSAIITAVLMIIMVLTFFSSPAKLRAEKRNERHRVAL